ncbi:MAG: hypothetical protein AAB354_05455 [candidate division KSB1 bacterium]
MLAKRLVSFSVLVYGLSGLALLFMPQELLALQESSAALPVALVAQFLGAALLGFAAMNWMARGSILGGIYGRAVMNGNFTFAFISALLTIRPLLAPAPPLWLWCYGAVSVALAVAFGYLMFVKAR